MHITLIDTIKDRDFLLPLTYFREISNIRVGILKIKEKWERLCEGRIHTSAVGYLKEFKEEAPASQIFIRSSVIPTKELALHIQKLQTNTCLVTPDGEWVACKTSLPLEPDLFREKLETHDFQTFIVENVRQIKYPWELVLINADEIRKDFELLSFHHRIPQTVTVEGDFPVYIDPSAYIQNIYVDASEGPVIIDAHVQIFSYTYIKGPVAILDHSLVKAGTRIYNGTTLGPWTKVGGEIKNVLFLGYSNKGHDGFLGDSVVGEWCNFGAGTSNSNLKNNYSLIKMWSVPEKKFVPTGQQFLGLVMGDHSKTAINTSINTGTVIGVSSNIFTREFPPKFVNSFNWSGRKQERNYVLEKAMETARRTMARRNIPFDGKYARLFEAVWEFSQEVEGVRVDVE